MMASTISVIRLERFEGPWNYLSYLGDPTGVKAHRAACVGREWPEASLTVFTEQ